MTGRENREEYERIRRHRRKLELRRRQRQQRRRKRAMVQLCLFFLSLIVFVLIVMKYDRMSDQAGIAIQQKKVGGKTSDYGKRLLSRLDFVSSSEVLSEDASKDKADASVRIGSVGDVMMHLPIIEAYGGIKGSQHDFTPIFGLVKTAYESVDYMVANLETSLAGDSKPYSGFPTFNAPDAISVNLRDSGVDLQLLANNHMYDNGKSGFLRTISVLQQNQILYTGARAGENEPPYLIQDLNGIRIGIINYTFETETDKKQNRKSINGNLMEKGMENLLNSFQSSDLESFYNEIREIQKEMLLQEVEFTLLYLHWGNEYEGTPNSIQEKMAAGLCDLGIDAVIGSHSHVVQPLAVLMSQDGTHRMFCAYSLGNHLSNQRRERISSRPNGHTEDGLLLNLTISRVSGQVSITDIEAIPTYVYKSAEPKYYIIPIYNPADVETQTGLSGIQPTIQASYDRTAKILGNCVEDAKRELGIPLE